MKKIFTISLLLIVGIMNTISAQQFEKYRVWLDSQEVDGKKIIVGWCMNNTTSPVFFNYEAVLKLKEKKEDERKGKTLALPYAPTLLTKAIFTLNDMDFEHIRLVLLNQENEVLAIDKIGSPLPQQRTLAFSPPTEPPTTQKKETVKKPFELEIDGLVLDETRSKLARDFYESFYRNWTTLQINAQGQTIIIREMPTRIGIGSVVVVEVNDRTITQLNIRPRADLIEDLAGQLVGVLEQYLTDPSNHTIIQGDDLIGSGIY